MLILHSYVPESPKWLLANTAKELLTERRSAGSAARETGVSPSSLPLLSPPPLLLTPSQRTGPQ